MMPEQEARVGGNVHAKVILRYGLLACLALGGLALSAGAQEGHPLTGSWHGDWGTSPTQRTPVFIFMKWDSKNIAGKINPGPKAATLTVATLDPSKWTVHLEGDGKDATGNPARIVIDGKLDDLGSYHRTISGTWMQGATKGDFKVTRD
jgi:hypothetical protein